MDDSEYQKEAMFYQSNGKIVHCQLCPHYCEIKPNQIGLCKSRKNFSGILYSLVYGKPTAINIDPIEKKPLYHFYPSTQVFSIGTSGCNLSCLNCQNFHISQDLNTIKKKELVSPEKIIEICLNQNIRSIAYTYNEPTIFFEYMLDIAFLAKENNIKNVLVSNGFINEKPLQKLVKLIDAANIDIKCFDTTIYKNLCNADLESILNTILLLQKNTWLEITNLIIPDTTDNLLDIHNMCTWLVDKGLNEVPLHFTKFYPQYKLQHLSATPFEIINKSYDIAKDAGINYVYIGNVNNHLGKNTYCPKCNKLLIERLNYMVILNSIQNGKCPDCNTQIKGIW